MTLHFSRAKSSELLEIVSLLQDDVLGRTREKETVERLDDYKHAFHLINNDSNAFIIVGHDNNQLVALAQINFIQYLTFQGGLRAQIEGVRVHRDHRGQGIGQALFEYLIKLARERACHLVQLTTDKQRPEAFQFYEKLGFKATHEGFKLTL